MASIGKGNWWSRFEAASEAYVQHGLFSLGQRVLAGYRHFATAMDRLHVSGGRKLAVDAASEAMTLGLGGLVLVVALAIPSIGDTGDGNWLKQQDLAVTFLDRYGNEIGKRGIRHDDSVPLQDYPDHLIKAVLSTEDRRFYEHFGIDVAGTLRAMMANARASSVVQGGSSITQQLAKNLFLNNERTLVRKIREAFLALWLESRLSKQEILTLYLDRAYMGGGTFGVQAAAEFYFGKNVREVTLAESAMLAGLFKAPTKYAPHVNLPAARARANDVLANMVEAGFLTDGQVYAARRNPATPLDRKRDAAPDYYLDWAFLDVRKLADAGKLGADRVLTVKTPLDLDLQRRAETALEATLRQHGADYEVEQGAAVVMEPDGAVRAMVGGRDYGQSQFNRATEALRQPGSSFKPFVYAAAFQSGKYRRDSTVTDRSTCIGDWCPQNYNRSFSGSMPITSAMARSINTIPVQMSIALGQEQHPNHTARAARAGRDKIVALGRRMGLNTDLRDTPSLPIGSTEVTVIDMAAGFSVFANGGRRAEPYAAVDVRNSRGEVIFRRERDADVPEQVLERQVAEDMNYLLSKVNEEGTGRRAELPGIRSAGKTGTTNAYRDAWYVGYTGNFVTAVWMGNDDYTSTGNMTGGTLPAMTWKEIMSYAHAGQEIKPIPGLAPAEKPAVVAAAPQRSRGGAAPAKAAGFEVVVPERPATLSRRSSVVLLGIESFIREAADKSRPVNRAETPGAPATAASVASRRADGLLR
jgi:penicillin-binding protein 1A